MPRDVIPFLDFSRLLTMIAYLKSYGTDANNRSDGGREQNAGEKKCTVANDVLFQLFESFLYKTNSPERELEDVQY